MFTSRIRRAFATANSEAPHGVPGSATWTSNPSRLTLFGPNHEIVLFRDDISARLRRSSVRLKRKVAEAEDTENADPDVTQEPEYMDVDSSELPRPAEEEPTVTTSDLAQDIKTAQKLVKTILDQGYLSPFRQASRPVHWDYATAMHLYPLPTAMALVDATAPPFCVTYEGCHVMNPGTVLVPGRKGVARWVEYEVGRLGRLREVTF